MDHLKLLLPATLLLVTLHGEAQAPNGACSSEHSNTSRQYRPSGSRQEFHMSSLAQAIGAQVHGSVRIRSITPKRVSIVERITSWLAGNDDSNTEFTVEFIAKRNDNPNRLHAIGDVTKLLDGTSSRLQVEAYERQNRIYSPDGIICDLSLYHTTQIARLGNCVNRSGNSVAIANGFAAQFSQAGVCPIVEERTVNQVPRGQQKERAVSGRRRVEPVRSSTIR